MSNNNNGVRGRGQTPFGEVYRSSAVFRSLEVPLTAPTTFTPSSSEKALPHLYGPVATKQGEVFYQVKSQSKQVLTDKDSKPLPIPLIVPNAPHFSVFIQSDPVSQVIERVHSLFERNYVDAEFNPVKFKWKCACYANHNETTFVCQLFSTPEKQNYFILDFQRRSGDPFHFQSIHRSMNNELLKDGFVVNCTGEKIPTGPTPIRTFKPMALPDDFLDEVEEKVDFKDFEPLCQMCVSPFIDVQREGLGALASQLEESQQARGCLVPFTEQLFMAVARSRDIQVRRLAISALAWISSTESLNVKKEELLTVESLIMNEQEILETRRQAAKVLLNLMNNSATSLSSALKSAIIGAQDARLRKLVDDIKSRA
jgi:hypothetical protein